MYREPLELKSFLTPTPRGMRVTPASGSLACLLALCIALLAACAPAPKPDPVALPEAAVESEAEALREAERHSAVAALYQEQAAFQPSPRRETWLLYAAEALLADDDPQGAARILEDVDADALPPELADRYAWAAARVAMAGDEPDRALDHIGELPGPDTPAALQRPILELQAAAYEELGDIISVLDARMRLHTLLTDQEEREDNARQLLETMQSVPADTLEQYQDVFDDRIAQGWLRLGELTARLSDEPRQLAGELVRWRENYPEHPAPERVLHELTPDYDTVPRYPGQVALLLPLGDEHLANSAEAVLAGFMAGYYRAPDEPNRRPDVRVMDTSRSGPVAAYEQAVADGADLIVGPLTRPALGELVTEPLNTPILSLNYLAGDVDVPPAVTQFGLAPEDEARAAAERAWEAGHRVAVTLAPEGAWGERVVDAFKERFRALGGTTVASEVFYPDQRIFDTPVDEVLGLPASRARHQALQGTLRRPIRFQATPRPDIDFLFLVAEADDARQVKPQLEYHGARHLPVYATSHVYDGTSQAARDEDLNGIAFADMPWILDASRFAELHGLLEGYHGTRFSQLKRLYALGFDAFGVLPHLTGLTTDPEARYEGATGQLWFGDNQRLHRDLMMARFRDGEPEALAPLPSPVSNQ